jgi:glucose/arabinose dehydrogenase
VASEDLLRGFVVGSDAWARPAGLLVAPDGSLIVSDDFSGRIFRVRYTG